MKQSSSCGEAQNMRIHNLGTDSRIVVCTCKTTEVIQSETAISLQSQIQGYNRQGTIYVNTRKILCYTYLRYLKDKI